MNDRVKAKEELIKELQELHQDHDRLRKSYEKLRIEVRLDEEMILKLLTAINTTSDAIFLTNTEGIITYVNSGFTKLYGYTADEIVGKVTPRIIKSGLLDKEVYKSFWKTLENKTEVKGEILNKRKNGELVIIDGTASPIFDEQNTIIGFLGIQRDINERKQAEKALQESEKKYRTLVDNVGEGIGFVNPDEEFLFANSAAERIFGVSKGELLGKNLKGFLSEEQYLAILNQTKIRKKGQESIYEFELTRPDGKKRSVSILAVHQFDDNNKFSGTHGIFRDITEQKQAELALKQSEEKYKSLIETANVGMGLSKGGKSLSANPALQEILGYDENEIITKPFIDFFHPEDKALVIKRIKKRSMGDSSAQSLQARIIRKNRDIRNVEIATSSFSVNNEQYVQAVFTDITEKKQAEMALKESETKLRQLNVNKDRFISILGHDLKNPFNNILGFSEILTDEIDSLNKDEIKDIAGNINKSAQITNKLLEDILMWASAQQGRITFSPQNLSFSDICQDAFEVLKPIAKVKNITIDYSTADHINVFADIDMLKAVLRNLVSNAIKFTNKKGAININATKTDSNVTISVSDNGIGIAHDELKKLFDISEVLTTKGTAGETGTGLGLLLCKEFVEKHQGKIWVESTEGKGSDFKFSLPISVEQPNALNKK